MAKQTSSVLSDGRFARTQIGLLHEKLMSKGLPDELYCEYRPHLKVLLKTMGRQPDNIQADGRELVWISHKSILTVTLAEHPF